MKCVHPLDESACVCSVHCRKTVPEILVELRYSFSLAPFEKQKSAVAVIHTCSQHCGYPDGFCLCNGMQSGNLSQEEVIILSSVCLHKEKLSVYSQLVCPVDITAGNRLNRYVSCTGRLHKDGPE